MDLRVQIVCLAPERRYEVKDTRHPARESSAFSRAVVVTSRGPHPATQPRFALVSNQSHRSLFSLFRPAARVICGACGRPSMEEPQAACPQGHAARPRPGKDRAKRNLAPTGRPRRFAAPAPRNPFAFAFQLPGRGHAALRTACGPSANKRPPAPQIPRVAGLPPPHATICPGLTRDRVLYII